MCINFISAKSIMNLENFHIINEIGHGTNGTVYKAVDSQGEICAIKVLNQASEFACRRLDNENDALHKLHHEGIIQSRGTGVNEDGIHFMVMEFFDGINFREYMNKYGSLSLKSKVQTLIKIADAIGAAHRAGYVHRDIKPSNILINPESGQVKITDFGIVLIPSSTLTRPIHIVGTPCYLSPEGFQSSKVTAASDVYSFGAMAYEFLLGRPLFDYTKLKRVQEMRSKAKNEKPLSPLKVDKSFPVNLARVLEKMIYKDPEQRYPDCNIASRALRKVLNEGFKKTKVIFRTK